jgi:AcrR family transcriptional regulator
LFAKQGFEGTSIRDIAGDAGVTTASLYHYIKTKEDLLLAIMSRGLNSLLESTRRTLLALDRPEDRLVGLVRMHVAIQGSYQMSTLVIDTEYRALSGENRAAIKKLRDEYEVYWRDTLWTGVCLGVFGHGEPKLTTLALLGACNEVAHWYRRDGELSLEAIENEFADMALALVRAGRDGRPVRVADLDVPDPVIDSSGFYEHEEVEA